MRFAAFGEKFEFLALKEKINQFCLKNNLNFTIDFYENLKIMLQEIANKKIQMVFLIHSRNFPDIINISIRIKEENQNCKIVFCSETEKFAVAGYKFKISFYLLIPISEEDIYFILKEISKINETIVIKTSWQKTLVYVKDIMFAEKQGHNVLVHCSNKTLTTRTTFKNFAELFKNKTNFVSCIKGTIVNLDWVDCIISQNFIMKTGEKIPIRRQDRKKIKEFLLDYNINKNF